MVKVLKVKKKSLPAKLGICEDSRFLKINGCQVDDQLDIAFLSDKKSLNIQVSDNQGNVRSTKIPSACLKDIEFEPLKPKKCGCKCIFCFIDQLPAGLRKSLYHKDEDYRFSYLCGNYVTLENLNKTDLEKIIRYRLSPLYVSVHATDPELRRFMLGRKKTRSVLPVIEYLAKNRITMHCQIVLCGGINGGQELRRTVEDLSVFHPYVETIAVVPVGLTAHRDGLFGLTGVDVVESLKTFAVIEGLQKKYVKKFGSRFVYLSDEFYVLAGKEIPVADSYGDFSQMENGVGLLRYFIDDAEKLLGKPRLKRNHLNGKSVVVTGEMAWKYLNPYIKRLADLTRSDIKLMPVKNAIFGGGVNVTGLLGGRDVIRTLKNVRLDYLFLPDVMLREKQDTFLDDITLSELKMRLKIREIYVFEPVLSGLYKALLKVKS
jgi:putative radical SAM enzyme (TIGR03279 family)